MNGIFIFSIISSFVVLLISEPQSITQVMQDTILDCAKLSLTLLCIYSVWLAIFQVLEDTKLTEKLEKATYKPINALFGNVKGAQKPIALNITANLLGLGGVATPMGIKAMNILEKDKNEYGKSMLFVLSATSIQLIPTSVIALRQAHNSASPSSIILPTLLTTIFSVILSTTLVRIFCKK